MTNFTITNMNPRLLLAIPIALAFASNSARADLTVDPGVTEVFLGTATSVAIPIAVVGDDNVTDLTAAINVAGAVITSVSYTGSIWESAPGGYIDFFPGFSPPGATVDPNLSLVVAGEAVGAAGTLFTITVDISSLPVGSYPITLVSTPAGDSQIFTSGGSEIATTFLPGTLRIIPKPIVTWREQQFPADFVNPAAEASIWGDGADPDCDGIPNFLEFAWGLDPNSPDADPASSSTPGIPTITTVSDGGQVFLAIQYSRLVESPCHGEEVGISGDLTIWDYTETDIAPFGSFPAHSNGITEFVTKRSTIPLSSAHRSFLKLRVTGDR